MCWDSAPDFSGTPLFCVLNSSKGKVKKKVKPKIKGP